jgi:hypothetical protein
MRNFQSPAVRVLVLILGLGIGTGIGSEKITAEEIVAKHLA